ncbi:hypothetical protein H6F89_29955 [Cyanobacteria bacterium FACHB-63]|nr:hypothetical protein [Cyanobacteria bacterium FACHB-63]
MNRLLIGCLSGILIASGAIANPVHAIAFRQVSASVSQGIGGGAVPTLDVSPTWGLTLSFIKTGELIQQVRVGDPSRVLVDFDSPLVPVMQSENTPTNQGRIASGATIIYLRQLSEPLDLGLRLPKDARNTQQIPLTVLTVDRTNQRRLYQFQLLLGRKTDYSTVEVVPEAQLPQRTPLKVRPVSTTGRASETSKPLTPTVKSGDLAQRFEQALVQAQAQQLVVPNTPLATRLQEMLKLLKQGTSLEAAARQTGVPMQVVNQIFN